MNEVHVVWVEPTDMGWTRLPNHGARAWRTDAGMVFEFPPNVPELLALAVVPKR